MLISESEEAAPRTAMNARLKLAVNLTPNRLEPCVRAPASRRQQAVPQPLQPQSTATSLLPLVNLPH